MLVYSTGHAKSVLRTAPTLNRQASAALAARLFPAVKIEPMADGNLLHTWPSKDELIVGCFPGVAIVASSELSLSRPSQLPARFLERGVGTIAHLHAMDSVTDWFAYAVWNKGRLERSLSVSLDAGLLEDVGKRLAFEEPYWARKHPATDPENGSDSIVRFDPLEFGETTLKELFGYGVENVIDPTGFRPQTIKLCCFKRCSAKPPRSSARGGIRRADRVAVLQRPAAEEKK